MSEKVIKLSDYNREYKKKNNKFDEYPEDVQIEMIKDKLYEESEVYCEETIKVVDKLKSEFTIFNSTILALDNPNIKRDMVRGYVLYIIDGFIQDKNIFTCNDEKYEQIRNNLFKKIVDHYFK